MPKKQQLFQINKVSINCIYFLDSCITQIINSITPKKKFIKINDTFSIKLIIVKNNSHNIRQNCHEMDENKVQLNGKFLL